MVTVAKVYLWGLYVGAVIWDEKSASAKFQYDEKFVRHGLDLSPLVMPLQAKEYYEFSDLSSKTFMGLPGLLADALPDDYGKVLLERWLATQGRSFANPVERLCYQGTRSMGALEFEPARDTLLEESHSIEIDTLVAVAGEILAERGSFTSNLDADTSQALADIIRVSTSAGGQRAKAVIAYNEATGEVRSGQVYAPEGFTHWLLKLDGVTNHALGDPQHYGRVEYVYHLMAQQAGIHMMPCRLFEENGRAHFMTQRFDRIGHNQKLHMQTLCGLAHYDYKFLRAYGYEQAFLVMRRLNLPYADAEQQFRRMVFNVIARNQDDHTKNISFLMNDRGEWRLSPAYDVSWAYNPKGDWTSRHQMSINGKWENHTLTDLLTVAESMNIRQPRQIVEAVREAVSQWRVLAGQHDIPNEITNSIEQSLRYNQF